MDNATPRVQLRVTAHSIERLLSPQSVAIVGASDKPGALGASVLANLDRNGYAGEIYLINPKRETIGARDCLIGIEDLPEGVDVAILAIPRVAVLDAVRALAARKCGAVIIFSAGFAEGGEAGLAEQGEIARIADVAGMIIEGPNCLGLVNYVDGVPLTFIETNITPVADRPAIGIVSQSGAMACVLAVTIASRDLALSYSVSTGNECASGVEDYVDYLIDEPNTRVITMIVEQFRKPTRFLAAAERARAAGKTIVLLHPGKSAAARHSAATHTGAMAGDYAVMRTKVQAAGVVFAETLEELADIAEIAIRAPRLPSGGTVVFGESGAFKALMLDLCEDLGIDLPPLDDSNAPALRAAMPDFVGVSNPLDLTAQGLVDPDLYYRTLAATVADDRFGAIVVAIIQTDPVTIGIKAPPILKAMREFRPDKPVIFAGLDEGAVVPTEIIAELRSQGVACFPSTERAFRALKRLNDLSARDFACTAPEAVAVQLPADAGVVPEYLSKAILAPLGIPFPQGCFATTLEAALSGADDIGYPVVLKAQSADLSHKSDAGGVILNVTGADEMRQAWKRLHANIAAYKPGLELDGVLIEKMGKRGVELIIGAKVDADWGPVILAGFGGVSAEILQDVRLLVPSMSIEAIIGELLQLKSAALLTGFRGSPALDVTAVAGLIAAVGRLLLAEPRLRELDLNPVVVYPNGDGIIALDALMLTGE
jgi:acyl-CoA synthetase (NDP forming)